MASDRAVKQFSDWSKSLRDKTKESKSTMPNIQDLLTQLKSSTDKREKSKIRAQLRKLGHRGGTQGASAPAGSTATQPRLPFRPSGKGQDLDRQFAAVTAPPAPLPPPKLAQLGEPKRKNVGRRAKTGTTTPDLPAKTRSKPPMRGSLCLNCEQSKVYDHDRQVWDCPKCHPDSFTPAWPTEKYNMAKKMLPVQYALGFAPDWGWFIYKDAKSPYSGYERIGEFHKGPIEAVKSVM